MRSFVMDRGDGFRRERPARDPRSASQADAGRERQVVRPFRSEHLRRLPIERVEQVTLVAVFPSHAVARRRAMLDAGGRGLRQQTDAEHVVVRGDVADGRVRLRSESVIADG